MRDNELLIAAYDAYRTSLVGDNGFRGMLYPKWERLPDAERAAWEAAADVWQLGRTAETESEAAQG